MERAYRPLFFKASLRWLCHLAIMPIRPYTGDASPDALPQPPPHPVTSCMAADEYLQDITLNGG